MAESRVILVDAIDNGLDSLVNMEASHEGRIKTNEVWFSPPRIDYDAWRFIDGSQWLFKHAGNVQTMFTLLMNNHHCRHRRQSGERLKPG